MNEFKFEVYNSRLKVNDTYKMKHTPTGWYVSHISINGDCEPDGERILFVNLNHDNISYPNNLGNMLEHLWGKINKGELNFEEAQSKLQELADWVSNCERSTPKW